MPEMQREPFVIYDDREWVVDSLTRYTGVRRYGSLHVRGSSVRNHLVSALPASAREKMIVIEPDTNLDDMATLFPTMERDCGVLVVSARGAVLDGSAFRNVVMRMPYAVKPVVDRQRYPLFVYFPRAEMLKDRWSEFRRSPLHLLRDVEIDATELAAPPILTDIGELPMLLRFIAGSTVARSFNQVSFDDLTYRKRSANKAKMRAEHDFYSLIPNSMKPWMAGMFNYREDADGAEYTMLRYHFADAAFQWIHNAWTPKDYDGFLVRALHFLDARPSREASKAELEAAAEGLFISKVRSRWDELLANPVGASILNGIANSPGGGRVVDAIDDYMKLVQKKWRTFAEGKMVVGHGDPCLSNILYDPATSTMKLIDPKGAISESELWTHSLYDYCKLSHSILGDYDFINNMLFDVVMGDNAEHRLVLKSNPPQTYKQTFERQVSATQNLGALRLGEASLFLSMLPLHLDNPRKVAALLLRARGVLDSAADLLT